MKKFVQFIAGAVCPECKSLDTIAINANDDEIYCVNVNLKKKDQQITPKKAKTGLM